MKAIGELKTKAAVYCEICGCKHIRTINQAVYENTENAINEAKIKLTEKANKPYTCRVCKSIVA